MNDKLTQRTIIKTARTRLAEHKTLGKSTSLSIYEVAELHDIITGASGNIESERENIGFSLN